MTNQQKVLTDILAKRRDKAIASVLGVKERECDPFLADDLEGREASIKLRKVILDQFNELTDLAFDLLQSLDNDVAPILNEHYLHRLDQMYDDIGAILVRLDVE